MPLILLVFFTAFAMEAIGTYISVIGLGVLFAMDPVILTMAVTFDVVKLIFISILYQKWKLLPFAMRYFMLTATLVFMTISGAGNFGYLSSAFQKALAPNMAISLKVDAYNKERDMLVAERADLQKQSAQINEQIAKEDDPKRKQGLIWSFRADERRIGQRLPIISKRIDELNDLALKTESQNIDANVHAGPITYIAKAFHISLEDASKYIIGVIVGVFDPSAVMLVMTGNFLLLLWRREREKKKTVQVNPYFFPEPPTPEPPKPEPVPEPEPEPEPVVIPEPVSAPAPVVEESKISADKPKRMRRQRVRTQPLTPAEKQVLSKVYDPVDTGESPEDSQPEHDEVLERRVHDYIPVDPELVQPEVVPTPAVVHEPESIEPVPVPGPAQPVTIDVFTEGSFSGTPQTELIDAKMKSSLETTPQVEAHPLLTTPRQF